jgi:hypothetical protein
MNSTNIPGNLEDEDNQLLNEEKELMNELKLIQDKHKNVILVYEKVVDNIKQLCKMENKKEESYSNPNILNNSNMNESRNVENAVALEDDLLKNYTEFVDVTKKRMEPLYLNHTKQDLLDMMREKGIEPIQANKSLDNRISKKMSSKGLERKIVIKETIITNTNPNNGINNNSVYEEYDYSDEDVRKVDDIIKKDQDEIIKEYMIIVKNIY